MPPKIAKAAGKRTIDGFRKNNGGFSKFRHREIMDHPSSHEAPRQRSRYPEHI